MRIVIDTNVLFSALYRPDSAPGRLLLLAIEGDLELFAPETVRDELQRILRIKLGYSEDEWNLTVGPLPVEWVEEPLWRPFLERAMGAISDPDDAPVVALAIALRAGIVSGDKAFHPLKKLVAKTWKPRRLGERFSEKAGKRKRK